MTTKDIEVTNTAQNDFAEFAHYLDGSEIPVDQQEEFLALLWSIMVQFAALGFGADTASQAINAVLLDPDDIDKGIKLKNRFKEAAE
ncbi:hypothetical protein [uncultured Tateyamaria sp.]|uniref:hypothetical protein n=1 Tax=uncultured Tateyamaria sp. TaxID=455651 RepID=UPI0026291097|nr:hypothetical protein [uncultured Tateyamaria sp.]